MVVSIFHPRSWPVVFAHWRPEGGEGLPTRIGVTVGGKHAWYRLDREA